MTAAEALKYAEKNGAKMVDFKFVDLLGIWQHTTMPIAKLNADVFKDGYFFDGSSIRGWQPIHASDMIFIPDPASAIMDPFYALPTLSLTCDIVDAVTHQPYSKDPRTIAGQGREVPQVDRHRRHVVLRSRARVLHLRRGPLLRGTNRASYFVDSVEGVWNTDREEGPNLGYKPAKKGGYFPVPPTDTLTDIRAEMAMTLEAVGIPVEVFHHEVATGGQCELSMRFNSLKAMADWTMWYKYVVKNVARKHGKTATFMPKPLFGDNGSGMHCHQSIWKDEKNLFAGDGYAGPLGDGAALHRRHPQARAGDLRVHQPGHEQLQAAGAGLRGAGEPGVLVAQPLGVGPHPDRRQLAEGQAARVPLPRPDGEPVPGVRGHADGRPRRHPEQDRPGQAAGQGHLRARVRKRRRTSRRPRARSTRRSTLSSATTRSCSRATSSPPTSSRPGSTTSGRTRSTPSACARTPTSSRSTSTTSSEPPDPGRGAATPTDTSSVWSNDEPVAAISVAAAGFFHFGLASPSKSLTPNSSCPKI